MVHATAASDPDIQKTEDDGVMAHMLVWLSRLLFGVFALDTKKLLGTAVTAPIRVFVNNDVPSKTPPTLLSSAGSQASLRPVVQC